MCIPKLCMNYVSKVKKSTACNNCALQSTTSKINDSAPRRFDIFDT